MIKIKNDIFVCVEGDKGSDLPQLNLIEFKDKTKEKNKILEENFKGKEIDCYILDPFYKILQEYICGHYESYKYPSNILYLKENEIVVSFEHESSLIFIKIKNDKIFDKKNIKYIYIVNENKNLFLFFLKEKNYLLCGFEKGLFIIDNINKIIIKKLLADYYITYINL